MNARRTKRMRAHFLLSAGVLVYALCGGIAAGASQEGFTTTDDQRRVPIPARKESDAAVLVIRNGTLIDGTGRAPIARADIVVRGDKILAAGAAGSVDLPDRPDRVIDANGLHVLPGLIDLHLHFSVQRGDDFTRYRDSDAAAGIRGTLLAQKLIRVGITSVREPGGASDVALRLKEAVQRGMLEGPRVFWSGRLIASRGGHADEITSTATGRPISLAGPDRARVATGPWDWRLAVREQIRMHADWIKLTAPYTREEVTAAVEEAHLHEIPVTVDSFGQFTLWAAEAGIDSIEHPLDLSPEIIKAMARHKTDFVPTLTAFYNVLRHGYPAAGISAGGFYHTMSRRFPMDHEQHLRMVRAAHAAGVRIGVGTDIPFETERRYPEDYYTELGFLKQAGMTDAEVLASATRVGAEILKMGDRLGTIESGKLADILIVEASPLADIQNLRKVRYVVAGGKVVGSE